MLSSLVVENWLSRGFVTGRILCNIGGIGLGVSKLLRSHCKQDKAPDVVCARAGLRKVQEVEG